MDTDTVARIFRWIHILAGGAWLGEVVAVVFILVPILVRLDLERRGWFLSVVFPRVFRLASILSATAVTAGALLYLASNEWSLNLGRLTSERWGISILIGGSLGLALTVFHFVVEGRIEPVVVRAASGEIDEDRLVRFLTIVPRIGLAVLVVIFGAMMYASRGV
jgi:uncharacterized membrane protein